MKKSPTYKGKFYFFSLFLILIPFIGYGQLIGNRTFKVEPIQKEIIDTTNFSILYELTIQVDSKDKNSKSKGYAVLQIGNQYDKFSDYYELIKDSLEFAAGNALNTNQFNELINISANVRFNTTTIKDKKIKNIVYQKVLRGTYQYQKPTPNLDWNISKETKELSGRTVRKANLSYGGRKWTAWYDPEVPVFSGPYVFSELPGLIIELYDLEKQYYFLMISNDDLKEPLYLKKSSIIKEITEKQYLRYEKSYHKNPGMYVNQDTRGVSGSGVEIPYNPIERNE